MSALQGTNIVLLGHLSKSAYEWKNIIKKNGGTVSQLASAKVTHLVTTEDESRFQQETIKKAVASRIAIVKEEWLTDSIAQGSPLPFAAYSIGDVQPSQSEVEERQTAVQTLASSARDSLSYSGGNDSYFSSSSSSSSSSQAQQDPSKIPALPDKPLAARTSTISTSAQENYKDFTKTNYTIKNRVVLQCTDIKNNNNKFYCLELHESPQGNTRLFTHYGRTDIVAKNPNGGITEFRYAEKNICQAAYLRLYDEKLKKGYEPIELIGSNIGSPKAREIFGAGLHEAPSSSSSSSSSSFSSSSLSPELSAFVSKIFDEATTALIANVAAEITPLGIKTPLGVLTVSQIEKGERILDQIEAQLSSTSSVMINTSRLESLSSSFYSAIPHKIGRSQSEVRAASIDTAAKLTEKRETVTLMKDLVKLNERGALSTGAVDLKYKALGCTLEPISLHSSLGEHIRRWVTAQVRSGQKSAGEIVSIHAVTRSDERTRFSDVGNQKLLFHGSRACNVVGLLSRGILDPASVVHKGGRRTDVGLLGDGIYFTDSIGTASKYAHPGKSNTKFALVHRVSLGNVYQTTAHMVGIREPPTRFDSVHGVRSESSAFDDDEFVIYNIRRQYQELLIEFREGPLRTSEPPPVPEPNLSSISSGTLSSQPSVVEEAVAFTPPVWSARPRPAPKPVSVAASADYWSTEAIPEPSAPPASSFIPSHSSSSSSSSGPIPTEEAEEKYRRLFASNRNSSELNNPYVNLINVFENKDKFQLDTKTVVPNLIMQRQVAQTSPTGSSVCLSNDHFRSLFRAFTMGALHGLDWTNVFAAGGSVLHCLENFHADATNNSSDVDLFIYGLSESAANKKVREIYNAILVNTPQAAIVRGKHAITIIQEYPTRHIQIVLRLYKSPAEILMGFDIDCCSVGFDGNNVWATPRACRALNQRVNRVDLTRRSLTYEVRLYKYAKRGYAVALPKPVDNSRVSPFLRQKKVGDVRGLARLLIFNSMMTTGTVALDKSTVKTFREDDRRIELQLRSAQEDSDYNNILIPWGPRFTINTILSSLASIQSKISETNSSDTFFISGIEGVINGETSDRSSVRGPIQWVSQNPGAQLLTSSFHPLDAANWEDDAYAPYPNNPNVVFIPIASSSTSSPFPKKKTTISAKAPRKDVFGKKSKFLPTKKARASIAASPAPAPDPFNSLFAQRPTAPATTSSNNFSNFSNLSNLSSNNSNTFFGQSAVPADVLREMGQPKGNAFNFGGPAPSFSGIGSNSSASSAVPSSLQTNVRTANLSSITTEQEPISPTKLMDRFSAIAPQSDVSKLLLLIATLCRKGLINESERQQLKDFVIQRKGSLVSALEVFEIEHDFEELADTLKRICRLSR